MPLQATAAISPSATGGTPLEVHLSDLFINNQVIAPSAPGSPLSTVLDATPELRLDFDRSRTFTIAYGIIDPASASSAMYQVLVEGIDRDWRDVGTQRNFTAMDFAPGTYKLKIRASKSPDAWDDAPVKEIVIRIAPPFYLSVWAFIVYLIVLAILAVIVYRFVKEREKCRQTVAYREGEERRTQPREDGVFHQHLS